MAYYEDVFTAETDATGSARITIGDLSTRNVYFLGFIVCVVGSGSQGFIAILYNRQGNPLAAASGFVPCIGPLLHKVADTHYLQITNAPPNSAVQATLVGDAADNPDDLVVRPQPTQAGTTLTGNVVSTITVAGTADMQGGLQVEGASGARFAGSDPWYDVTHPSYGADSSGNTNSTAACNKAATAIQNAGGGEAFFPAGSYMMSGNGMRVWANMTVRGCGVKSRIFLDPSVGYVPAFGITIGNDVTVLIANVIVRDLYFDGNERSMTYNLGPVISPIYGEGTGNYIAPVHEGICTGLIGAGFNGSQTQNLKVIHCTFYDWSRDCVAMGTARNVDGQIDHIDTLIAGCTFNASAYCASIESTQRFTFTDNIINGVKMTDPLHQGYAIAYNYRDLNDVCISNNRFDGQGGNADGIRFQDNRQGGHILVSGAEVTDNTIRNFAPVTSTTSGGIEVAINAYVAGNTIISCHGRYGIYAIDNCVVEDNTVEQCDLMGINLGGPNMTCSGNKVHSNNRLNSATAVFRCGIVFGEILIPDTTSNCVVTDNKIWDDSGGGAQYQYAFGTSLAAVASCTVANNDVTGNKGVDGSNFVANVMKQAGARVYKNNGLNPVGAVGTPAMPASGTAVANNFGVDCNVYLTAPAANTLQISIGLSVVMTIPAAQVGMARVAAGTTITPTYAGGVPAWVWDGE